MPPRSQAENAVFRNGGALPACAAPFRRVFGPGGESYAYRQDRGDQPGSPPGARCTPTCLLWGDHAAGKLTDAEAQQLAETIEARRKALKRPIQGHSSLKVLVVREEAER